MANYTVTLYETIYHTVEVKATDEDTAIIVAMDIVTGDSTDYETESQGINAWETEIEETQ